MQEVKDVLLQRAFLSILCRRFLAGRKAFDAQVHGGQAGDDVAVAAFEEVDVADDGGAASDGSGDDVGQPGAQIGDGDVIGGSERRWSGDDRAVFVVAVAIAAGNAAQAVCR